MEHGGAAREKRGSCNPALLGMPVPYLQFFFVDIHRLVVLNGLLAEQARPFEKFDEFGVVHCLLLLGLSELR